MANEGVVDSGQQPVIEQPASTGAPASSGAQPVAGTPHPDNKAWETERAGFLKDLQAERQARQRYEQQAQQYAVQVEQERKRVQALAGVNPQSPQDVEAAEIKARFAQLYPELAGLTAEDIEALRSWKSQSTQFEETTKAMWRDKARTTTSAVESRVAKELGVDALTPGQAKILRAAFVHAAENDEQFLERYEQGDTKLAEEFASQFIADWIEPARRRAIQQQTSQFRRVPSGKDRSIPSATTPKIDVTDSKAVEDFLLAGRRERGEGFGRR